MVSVKSWRVENFKSVASAELEFPRLTVVTGANSSGKSSILQSLLLLAQSNKATRAVVLNGPLIRLGLARDVVRAGQSSMTFEFKLGSAPDEIDEYTEHTVTIELAPVGTGKSLGIKSFSVLNPVGVALLEAKNAHVKLTDKTTILSQRSEGASVLRVTRRDGHPAPPRSYVVFEGITPTELRLHRSPKQLREAYIALLRRHPSDAKNRRLTGIEFLRSQTDFDLFSEQNLDSTLESMPLTDLQRLADNMAAQRRYGEFAVFDLTVSAFMYDNSFRGLLGSDAIEENALREWHPIIQMLVGLVSAAEEFGSRLRYLGPLRDEPKVLQSAWDQRNRALPVGARGELTAEILASRKTDVVDYADWNGKRRTDALPDALGIWATYLGIGEGVAVADEGKLGRGVNVRVNGVLRDLTMIGVGASQLLPVLLACLGASAGSVVLIEQPELHLHPAVQSRLGDFFLFARPDLKLIIETHSEYLITRVRLRLAEERVAPPDVAVLFAYQDRGVTEIKTLTPNVYGDLDQWPEGFFDSQEIDSRAIVRQVTARMRSKASD